MNAIESTFYTAILLYVLYRLTTVNLYGRAPNHRDFDVQRMVLTLLPAVLIIGGCFYGYGQLLSARKEARQQILAMANLERNGLRAYYLNRIDYQVAPWGIQGVLAEARTSVPK